MDVVEPDGIELTTSCLQSTRLVPTELWPCLVRRTMARRARGVAVDDRALEGWLAGAVRPKARRLVGPGRLELPTSRLSGVRSNQLSYGP